MRFDDLVVLDDRRGMASLLALLEPLPALRAARALLADRRRLAICTGFPVAGRPETDGPAGSIVLARALQALGREVVLLSWRDTLERMQGCLDDIRSDEVPCGATPRTLVGVAAITIEVCGRTADGSYRNIRGVDVRADAPWFEDAVGSHALISIGDGGNEFGMGSAPRAWFDGRAVARPESTCDVLVAAQVSNWGALAVVAGLSHETGATLLPEPDEYERLVSALAEAGMVDGIDREVRATEDGFPARSGAERVRSLRDLLSPSIAR